MEQQAECPDGEAGHDGELAGAVAREAALEVDRGNGVEAAEAPVEGVAVLAPVNEIPHRQPAADMHCGVEPVVAQIEGTGYADDQPGRHGNEEGGGGVDVQSVESGKGKKRKRVQQ